MSVIDAIRQAIADIEAEHDVRVLFAAESGSRAWGFASPDSDFDVRFIYVHRRDWYLGIDEPRDVIEAMLPGDLDLSGWDLRKSLRLFLRCNIALNEWLGSPIIYAERGDLAGQLRTLIPSAFRAPAGYHHYLRMARGVYSAHVASDPVRLKKVFYVLRPLLACRWIAHTGSQPPTEFEHLATAAWVNADERLMIARLTEAKADASESHRTPLDPSTRAWFEQELAAAEQASAAIRSTASIDTSTLSELLRRCVDAT
jgi:uncharacterized protein